MKKLFFSMMLAVAAGVSYGQGMIVNEISQGTSGAKEYIELLVVGSAAHPTDSVDLSDWIIDDNNGDFRLGDGTAPGIATGHFRFALNDTMMHVPVGALIVLYNANDTNGNWNFVQTNGSGQQIAHIENNGMVYYIPGTSTLLRAVSGFPSAASASYTYTSSTVPPNGANWTGEIGLANSGDAIQVRKPDGTFYHGFVFSTPSLADSFTDAPVFTDVSLPSFNGFKGSATGRITYFTCGSWYYADNYITGNASTDETPGVPNNADNDSLIAAVRAGTVAYSTLNTNISCGIALPVTLASFSLYIQQDRFVVATWRTVSEKYNDHFMVERSADQKRWQRIGNVPAKDIGEAPNDYSFTDAQPLPERSFYRIVQVDRDGKSTMSEVKWVYFPGRQQAMVYPNPIMQNRLTVYLYDENADKITVTDVTGKIVYRQTGGQASGRLEIPAGGWSAGIYWVRIQTASGIQVIQSVKR